jgi:hypothetical protein
LPAFGAHKTKSPKAKSAINCQSARRERSHCWAFDSSLTTLRVYLRVLLVGYLTSQGTNGQKRLKFRILPRELWTHSAKARPSVKLLL